MSARTVCTGEFTLPLSIEQALPLFTPEGERRWAGHAWDPRYADGAAGDRSDPGTVFTTESTGGDAVWIVLGRTEDSIAYARVVPGRNAGTVRVTCSAEQDGCRVRVAYDLTSLGPEGNAFVREFEDGYAAFLEHWRQAIVESLSSA